MSVSLSPWLKPRFFITGTNKPLAGGLMYTYEAGTTTNATTYSDDTGTPNTNPIVLNSDGECNLYLDDDVIYRIILKNAAGVTQFDKDNISSNGAKDAAFLSFENVANLRLAIGNDREPTAQTSGYYNAGDGGGNSFYWDGTSSATDDAQNIIKPTLVSGAGRWLLLQKKEKNQVYSILEYIPLNLHKDIFDGVATVDHTSYLQAAWDALSAIYTATGITPILEFTAHGTYNINGAIPRKNVWTDFKSAILKKTLDASGDSYRSIIRTTVAGYGNYENIRFFNGFFNPNGKTCPSAALAFRYMENAVFKNMTVLDCPPAAFGFGFGGKNVLIEGCRVLGGSEIGEDGFHCWHGQNIKLIGCHAEAGDDCYSFNRTSTDGFLTTSPDPIDGVDMIGCTGISNRAWFLKVDVEADSGTQTSGDPNWEIKNIRVVGGGGTVGKLRNGGIEIVDQNYSGSSNSSNISNITIKDVEIKLGTIGRSDTVGAYGVFVRNAKNIDIDVTLSTEYQVIKPVFLRETNNVNIALKMPVMPTGTPALGDTTSYVESRETVDTSLTLKTSGGAVNHVMCRDSKNLTITDSNIRNLANTYNGVVVLGSVFAITGISRVDVISGGSGYVTAPIVTITGDGTGATATAYVANGAVVRVVVTSGGTGYTTASLSFDSGAATASAIIGGENTTITLLNNNVTHVSGAVSGNSFALNNLGVNATRSAVVLGNRLYSPAPISNGALVYNIANNIGYKTQNRGQSSVSAGNTTATVSHNCQNVGSITQVLITPNSSVGVAYWVSNVTSSQFTINLSSTLGSTVAFTWQIDSSYSI